MRLFLGVQTKENHRIKNVGTRKMLDLVVWAFWFIFGAYSFWFFFGAKTFQPLTLDNLALTWKLHKQETGCTAPRIHSLLVKKNEVVGFKCDCGYEFLQKRLVTQRVRKQRVSQRKLQGFYSSGVARVRREVDYGLEKGANPE